MKKLLLLGFAAVVLDLGLPGLHLGLRAEHYAEIFDGKPAVDWFEAVTENYLVPGGRPVHNLMRVRERFPVALHGVSLSIGSTGPLDLAYLTQLKTLASCAKRKPTTAAFSRFAMAPDPSVTQALLDLSRGERGALDRLLPVVYDHLHRIAERELRRERNDHTLSPTALASISRPDSEAANLLMG